MADKKPPVVKRRRKRKTSTALAVRKPANTSVEKRIDNLVLALNSHLGIDLEPPA